MSEKQKLKMASSEIHDYSKALFDQQTADFDTLDNKALGVIGIAGLLAGFQVLSIDTLSELVKCVLNTQFQWLPFLALVSLAAHGMCLIVCICTGLITFQVKEFHYPDGVHKFVQDADTKEKILAEIVNTYEEVAEELGKINKDKAEQLKYSVWSITAAILSLIVFLVFMVMYKCK
jgi:hypothetical protein